jgi:SAM-dependent methyltransferase
VECRNCGSDGLQTFLDLGHQPLANGFLTADQLNEPEVTFPLRPQVCPECCLIQLPPLPVSSFGPNYPFRSGQSKTWVHHQRKLIKSLGLQAGEIVIDVGGNDGTLGSLLPVTVDYINVDPSATSQDAVREYMTPKVAAEIGFQADYIVAQNVLAHVPDFGPLLAGIKACLAEDGVLIVEVPVNDDWTQVYHEHLAYFSEATVVDVLERGGFFVDGIEQIDTHGGSLRLCCVHS